jgi:xylulokinase
MPDVVLGIDVGTSGVGVIAASSTGEVLARADHDVALLTPHPGWTEQHPADWILACERGVAQVAREIGAQRITAIGLTGQMHGMVPLDAAERVIRPAILWNDQRTAAAVATMAERVGIERMIARGGNPPITGFQAPKVLWLRDAEPDAFARTRRVLLPKDYLALHLTGVAAAEPADASGTGVYHLAERTWDHDVLAALDLDPALWPPLQASDTIVGGLRADVAHRIGLRADTPVVIGAGDNAAAAVGLALGRADLGTGSVSLGTSGVLFAPLADATPEPRGRAHLFAHADGGFFLLGVTLSAGGSLRWFRDTFAPDVSFDRLMAEAAAAQPGAAGVTFLPYLAGERTPHLNPDLRGSLHGLTLASSRGDVVRAILEGVAFALADAQAVMANVARPRRYLLTGGGARSPLWSAIVAAALQTPVGVPADAAGNTTEVGAAEGAAWLAWAGIGHTPTRHVRVAAWQEPEPDLVDALHEAHLRYRSLTPPVQP